MNTSLLYGTTPKPGKDKYCIFHLKGFSEKDNYLTTPEGKLLTTESFFDELYVTCNKDIILGDNEVIESGKCIPYRIKAQNYGVNIMNDNNEIEFEIDMTYYHYLNDRSFPFISYKPDENNVKFYAHYKSPEESLFELKKMKNFKFKEIEDKKLEIEELDIKIKKLENNN